MRAMFGMLGSSWVDVDLWLEQEGNEDTHIGRIGSIARDGSFEGDGIARLFPDAGTRFDDARLAIAASCLADCGVSVQADDVATLAMRAVPALKDRVRSLLDALDDPLAQTPSTVTLSTCADALRILALYAVPLDGFSPYGDPYSPWRLLLSPVSGEAALDDPGARLFVFEVHI